MLGTTVACAALIPLIKRLSATSCPWSLAEFGGSVVQFVPHWVRGVTDGGPDGECGRVRCRVRGERRVRVHDLVERRRSVGAAMSVTDAERVGLGARFTRRDCPRDRE